MIPGLGVLGWERDNGSAVYVEIADGCDNGWSFRLWVLYDRWGGMSWEIDMRCWEQNSRCVMKGCSLRGGLVDVW